MMRGGVVFIGVLVVASVGLAQSAYEDALRYSQERTAFGEPIANFQAIQWMLADAATEIQAAAMAKLFATEAAERVCRNAIQIHGGYGYSAEFPVELTYRDARLMTIGEGVAVGTGAQRRRMT